MCIGGVQVAHGYLNRPDLTKKHFVENPFFAEMSKAKPEIDSAELRQLYRTGDYVRWTTEGAIEYVGRIDHQVKIRGLRIELGEIEAGLVAHKDVGQAIVVAKKDAANEQKIVAYTVRNNGRVADSSELRKHLRDFVPNYMVPNAFVDLPELPTTPNGKLDRSALPEPTVEVNADVAKDEAPRDHVEEKLVLFWEETLETKPIGIHDDFFDLGGHSLIALRMFAKIESEFGQKLPLSLLINAPTVAELAEKIREDLPVEPVPVPVAAPPVEKEWVTLFPIREMGNKRPFFYVTAYMESVLEYNFLSKSLDQDRPFYLFQAQGLDGEAPIHETIPDMAQRYILELKQVQPEGPYLLGGHCAGAWVALEMANMLTKAGDKVSFLAVVDSMPPHVPEPDISKPVYIGRQLAHYLKEGRLVDALKWQYELHMQSKVTEQFGTVQEKTIHKVRDVHHKAYENYVVPRDYTGPMLHVRCSEFAQNPIMDFHETWRDLTTQSVPLEIVESTHASILHKDNVSQLAHVLTAGLDSADAE